MVQCCRCNSSGRCRSCSCVKAKRACTDCLPGKNNKCCNTLSLNSPSPTTSTVPGPSIVSESLDPLSVSASEAKEDENPKLMPTPVSTPECPPLPKTTPDPGFASVRSRQHMMNSGVDIGLPVYCALPTTGRFTLGCLSEEDTAAAISSVYEEAVHFKPNAFLVPNGSVGRKFVRQLSEYLACFGNAGSYQGQALKIAMVFQQLLLQKPHRSQVPSFSKCLQRRMDLWQQGDIEQLLMKVELFKINYRAIIGVIPPQSLTLLGNCQ